MQVPGVDDITGEPLVRRKDDNADTLKNRLVRRQIGQALPAVDDWEAFGRILLRACRTCHALKHMLGFTRERLPSTVAGCLPRPDGARDRVLQASRGGIGDRGRQACRGCDSPDQEGHGRMTTDVIADI